MAGDLYYDNVSLLLHCDGTDGSTTFTDNSPTPKTVTVYGNAHIETDQSQFGGASGAFDGSGDYLALAANAAFNLYQVDATIECWVYLAGSGDRHIFGYNNTGASWWDVRVSSTNNVVVRLNSNTTTLTSSGTITPGQWTHVAVVCASQVTTIYLNGVASGSRANGFDGGNGTYVLAIGRNTYGGAYNYYFNGYLDEIRITKGTARYTANFTPPTEAFANYAPVPVVPVVPLALAAFAPSSPGQIEKVAFSLQAYAPASDPLLPPTALLALGAFPVELDGVLLPAAIEFRHVTLLPWIMPMTSPVYPPATTLTLDVPVPGVNIHGLWSPEAMLFGWEYDSGTDTISIPLATLFELTAAQANATTGDWRAVVLALVNSMWDSYVELDSPPRAMVLEYYPGYMMNVGPFTGHVKADYQATTYLNFPDKTLADEP